MSQPNEFDPSQAVDNPTLAKQLLCASVIIFGVGQSLLFVVFAPLAIEMGLTALQFGMVFSASNIFLVFAGPYWGRKSDVIGRKPPELSTALLALQQTGLEALRRQLRAAVLGPLEGVPAQAEGVPKGQAGAEIGLHVALHGG